MREEDYKKDDYKRGVVNYFKKNLSKGYTADTLKWSLIKQGYSRSIVEWALDKAQKELAEKAPLLKEKPEINYKVVDEKDKPVTIKKSWWKRLFCRRR